MKDSFGIALLPLLVAQFYLIAFGLITAVGGVVGYFKAQSVASLIAGTVCGALLIGAGLVMARHIGGASVLGLVVSLALLGRFAPALARGKMMPAAYMVPLSALGAVAAILLMLARWG